MAGRLPPHVPAVEGLRDLRGPGPPDNRTAVRKDGEIVWRNFKGDQVRGEMDPAEGGEPGRQVGELNRLSPSGVKRDGVAPAELDDGGPLWPDEEFLRSLLAREATRTGRDLQPLDPRHLRSHQVESSMEGSAFKEAEGVRGEHLPDSGGDSRVARRARLDPTHVGGGRQETPEARRLRGRKGTHHP